jgi:hypothetical protein
MAMAHPTVRCGKPGPSPHTAGSGRLTLAGRGANATHGAYGYAVTDPKEFAKQLFKAGQQPAAWLRSAGHLRDVRDIKVLPSAGSGKYELNAKGAGRGYPWTSRSVRYSRVRYSAFGKIERQHSNQKENSSYGRLMTRHESPSPQNPARSIRSPA